MKAILLSSLQEGIRDRIMKHLIHPSADPVPTVYCVLCLDNLEIKHLSLCVLFITFYLMFPLLSLEVTMISPSEGSTQGGTMLTISGRFFDQTDFPVRVLVGGSFPDFLIYCFMKTYLAFSLIVCKKNGSLFSITILN